MIQLFIRDEDSLIDNIKKGDIKIVGPIDDVEELIVEIARAPKAKYWKRVTMFVIYDAQFQEEVEKAILKYHPDFEIIS